jgi:hypothetical protein
MGEKKTSLYEKLVYVAYGYYILVALCWLLLVLSFNGVGSSTIYPPLFALIVFSVLAYYRQKLVNLIIGILTIGISIFGTLEFVSRIDKEGFNALNKTMVSVSIVSVVMSGILIFSYTKLAFKDQ